MVRRVCFKIDNEVPQVQCAHVETAARSYWRTDLKTDRYGCVTFQRHAISRSFGSATLPHFSQNGKNFNIQNL